MAEQENTGDDKKLSIIKIYVKDFSFESPQSPQVFRAEKWAPETSLNLRSTHAPLDDNFHEVVLTISVEAKYEDKTLFLIEQHQAGLFEVTGHTPEEAGVIFGSFCPNILFPYARESISSCIQRGGFPEFVLQPINFDALYLQMQQEQADKTEKH